MYDWAHGQSDAIEGITHSLCSLEFENHRPLYDWFLDHLPVPHRPRQIEFARLNMTYTRAEQAQAPAQLVEEGHVDGWDDPRMPTLCGMRRRGYTPEAIREFCERIGVTRTGGTVDVRAPRALPARGPEQALRREPWPCSTRFASSSRTTPDDQVEEMEAVNNPEDPAAGTRKVPFSPGALHRAGGLHGDARRRFFRLAPGREVRLRYAYFITCSEVVKDADGRIVELRCTYDPATRGGDAPDGRKVKATLHWVSAAHAIDGRGPPVRPPVRQGGSLRRWKAPRTWLANVNPNSLRVLAGCKLEPSLAQAEPGDRYQFERKGYFCVDPDSCPGRPVFNRTVSLRDTWAKKRDRT